VKLKKQISYADAKKIPYTIIAGEDEINNDSLTIKIMSSGEQKSIPLIDLSSFVKEELRS
jgi:histidyl-tRNA synthetase